MEVYHETNADQIVEAGSAFTAFHSAAGQYTGLCCQDSAMMVFDGKVVNKPYKDGRSCSDIVYVGEGE